MHLGFPVRSYTYLKFMKASRICEALLQCRNIAQVRLDGCPYSDGLSLYSRLLSKPTVTTIVIESATGFPLSLLQESSAMKSLSFDFVAIKVSALPSEPTKSAPTDKISLRELKLFDVRNPDTFLTWLASPTCFLDFSRLEHLEYTAPVTDHLTPAFKTAIPALQAFINILPRTLTSFTSKSYSSRSHVFVDPDPNSVLNLRF